MIWTDKMVVRMLALRSDGLSYGAIGEVLGLPRKSVETKAKELRRKGYDLPKRVGGVRKPTHDRVDYTVRTPWGSTWEIGGDAETTEPFVDGLRANGFEAVKR